MPHETPGSPRGSNLRVLCKLSRRKGWATGLHIFSSSFGSLRKVWPWVELLRLASELMCSVEKWWSCWGCHVLTPDQRCPRQAVPTCRAVFYLTGNCRQQLYCTKEGEVCTSSPGARWPRVCRLRKPRGHGFPDVLWPTCIPALVIPHN